MAASRSRASHGVAPVPRLGRPACWRQEHVEIFRLEPFPPILPVNLDDAQGHALLSKDRHAHDRTKSEVSDALALVEAFIVPGVGAENRLARLHGVIDDRMAHSHWLVLGVITAPPPGAATGR